MKTTKLLVILLTLISVRTIVDSLRMVSMTDEALVSGSRRDLKSVQPVNVCREDLPKKQLFPKSFCVAPKKFAVNWSPAPVFNNQVFTRGDVPQGRVNLITVFVHELGHSFGLRDRPHSDRPSVMDVEYVVDNLEKTLSPSEVDLQSFVQVLKDAIQGSKPGEFKVEGCEGLIRSPQSFRSRQPPRAILDPGK